MPMVSLKLMAAWRVRREMNILSSHTQSCRSVSCHVIMYSIHDFGFSAIPSLWCYFCVTKG